VSCIELNLPAWAGRDTSVAPGSSVYIGRQSDVGIDEACMWFKLPNTTAAIDTAAGLWVSPVNTSSYIVRQEICGLVKWDTVVVHMDLAGLGKLQIQSSMLNLWPVPADDILVVELVEANGETFRCTALNNLGQVMREEDIVFKDGKAAIR